MFEPILLLGAENWSDETWRQICGSFFLLLLIFIVKVVIGFFYVARTISATVAVIQTVSALGDKDDLHDTLGPEDKFSKKDPITNRWVHEDSIEWIDIACKDNKKIYDPNGDIIVIGHPSSKIHTMATYDINGTLIEDSSVKVKKVARKVIFMDPEDKKDEKGKLKKLYEEGYISKSKYNSLMRDLSK